MMLNEIYCSVISTAIIALLRELESSTESAFGAMSRTSWPTLNQVSGQSGYVGVLVGAIEAVVEATKPLIEKKTYMRNFLDKASG